MVSIASQEKFLINLPKIKRFLTICFERFNKGFEIYRGTGEVSLGKNLLYVCRLTFTLPYLNVEKWDLIFFQTNRRLISLRKNP